MLAPVGIAAGYLYGRAIDQYASTVGFSVRTEEIASPIELLGGIADLSGSSSSDTDILYEYIQSQELVKLIDEQLDLRRLFAGNATDPLFSFKKDGSIEDLRDYWHRMARVDYDAGTGLIEFRVRAFQPADAQNIAQAVFGESSRMINELSAIARQDSTRYAQEELETSIARLKNAREALTAFRSQSQIVDPSADIQSQMGLLASLQGQLAEALISMDLLRQTTSIDDSRLNYAEQRIKVIEARIADERRKFGVGVGESDGNDYATLIAEFESLTVDREFAEQAYTTALAAFYAAQAEARRKSRYLAAYIQPSLAETAEYPQRATLLATLALFLLVGWSIAVLIYYSIRDRR